jgi:hypothetical protein
LFAGTYLTPPAEKLKYDTRLTETDSMDGNIWNRIQKYDNKTGMKSKKIDIYLVCNLKK